ncbi:oxidoreductase [Rhodovulum strictum]|uniref:Oxidoreductase n=1 Tax=Rhodovulum strictum TaxID=58314 RepID=A0A844BHT7_9RHOB|nr:oxidoreductase [Rhodovulum strictum]MRH19547.1 oxidoreductase [Rhodovulum strictum]
MPAPVNLCFPAAWVALALSAPALWADPAPLPSPSGPVVLTVTGEIAVANDGAAAVFDMDMLRALPATTIRTTTIWTTGKLDLTGVPLDALLARLGVEGGRLTATAINDYAVEIPVSDAVPGGPIIAYLENGAEMPRRKRGPLWIVYPYDDSPAYRTDVIYSRSIWQLDRIDVAR